MLVLNSFSCQSNLIPSLSRNTIKKRQLKPTVSSELIRKIIKLSPTKREMSSSEISPNKLASRERISAK